MKTNQSSLCYLNGNTLKIIAALSMLIDHIGAILFPKVMVFRIIGRLAFPIFAFMVAEGCRYTKNKLRHFLTIFLLAVICQIFYFLYSGDLYMSILVTFSLSILIIYALQNFKNAIYDKTSSWWLKLFSCFLLVISVGGVYLFTRYFTVDYGFSGCMLPVLASVFHQPKNNTFSFIKKMDNIFVHVCLMGVGLIILSIRFGVIQMYSLLALPFLLCYSGKRGKTNLKYFFYVFYPLHLVILEGIHMLME